MRRRWGGGLNKINKTLVKKMDLIKKVFKEDNLFVMGGKLEIR